MSRTDTIRACALLAATALAGCGDPEPATPLPDVLFVTIDTLRADHLGCYGASGNPTPFMDRLASSGALFERHYTVMSHTAPVHATLFTGLHPREHGLVKNGHLLRTELPSLPELLRTAGYRTGAAIGAKVLSSRFGFDHGFESFDEEFSENVLRPSGATGKHERYGESVVQAAARFLEQDDGRPLFLWVHLYDPHMPYRTPPDWQPPASLREQRPRVPRTELFDRERMLKNLTQYTEEVAYVDEQIGHLVRLWNRRVGRGAGLIVLTADHGEGLYEHDYQGHGFFLYEEQLAVPLVVTMPGTVPAGVRVPSVTSAADVAATTLALIGLAPPAGPGGRSLVPLWSGAEPAPADGGVAFAERRKYAAFELDAKRWIVRANEGGAGSGTGDLVALVSGRYKAIWSEDAPFELYDLAADPGESVNLAESEPELAAELGARIAAWRATTANAEESEQALEPEVQSMLEDLGY